MTTIYLKDLVKSYSGRRVVNSVSLEVKSGEVVGLLGPNGAGKTTTFYMTIGLVRPKGIPATRFQTSSNPGSSRSVRWWISWTK